MNVCYLSLIAAFLMIGTSCDRAKSMASVPMFRFTNGLTIAAWGETNKIEIGKPVRISYCLSNESRSAIAIWDSGVWPNTRVDVFDANSRPVGLTQAVLAARRAFSPTGNRDRNILMTIGTNQSHTNGPIDIEPLFYFNIKGRYTFVVTYEEGHEGGWCGKLVSQQNAFEIY